MDRLAHWKANLKGKCPPIHEREPQDGWYARRLVAKGPKVAAAIWHDEFGVQVCRVGNEMRDPVREWGWLVKSPVAEEDAYFFWREGKWPDGAEIPASPAARHDGPGPEPVAADQHVAATAPARHEPAVAAPGHNSGDGGDAYAVMQHELTAEHENSSSWRQRLKGKIASDADAKICADKVEALRGIGRRANAWKSEVVDPLYRDYDGALQKYNAVAKIAKAEIETLLAMSTDWQKAERRRLEKIEADRNAEAARIEAANLAKLKEAEAAPLLAAAAEPVVLEVVPDKVDTRATVKGYAGGRAIRLQTYNEIEIDSLDKALKALKGEPEIAEALLTIAKRKHKSEGSLPVGFKMVQKEKAA